MGYRSSKRSLLEAMQGRTIGITWKRSERSWGTGCSGRKRIGGINPALREWLNVGRDFIPPLQALSPPPMAICRKINRRRHGHPDHQRDDQSFPKESSFPSQPQDQQASQKHQQRFQDHRAKQAVDGMILNWI